MRSLLISLLISIISLHCSSYPQSNPTKQAGLPAKNKAKKWQAGRNAQKSDSIQQNIIRFLELGVSANAYRGDLTTKYEKWTQAFHVGIKLSRKKQLNGQIGITIGKVMGENINYTYETNTIPPPTPNKFFVTNFIIFNYDLRINIIKKDPFTLYISQGIGLMRFTPKDENNNDLASNPDSRAKEESNEYRNISFEFPFTIGALYSFKNGFGIGMQIGLLNQTTDYIDNISVLSNQKIRDNILQFKFCFYVPVLFEP